MDWGWGWLSHATQARGMGATGRSQGLCPRQAHPLHAPCLHLHQMHIPSLSLWIPCRHSSIQLPLCPETVQSATSPAAIHPSFTRPPAWLHPGDTTDEPECPILSSKKGFLQKSSLHPISNEVCHTAGSAWAKGLTEKEEENGTDLWDVP